MQNEIVWLDTERVYVYLVKMGTYYSIINRSGIPGEEEQVETDDITLIEDRAIEYEPDEF